MSAAATGTRRRVLVILHEEALGGATLSVLRCLPGLAERGWEFSFWAPPGATAEALRERGERLATFARPHAYSLRQLRLHPGPWARVRAARGYRDALRARIAAEAPALVHANSHVTLADAALARRMGVPTVIHIHEMFGDGAKWALGRRLVRRYGTEVIAVSDACAERLATDAYRPRVVLNGVELPPASPAADREPGRPFTVGTVAAIARRKGIDVLVEAVRMLREREAEIRFELIGATTDPLDAVWAERLLAEAERLGIDHRPSADVAAALRRWDLFVLPSRHDPFPLSSLEAMASGVPVVASDVDGLREQVTAETGRLVPSEQPTALADAIAAVAALPPEERARMGAAAREHVARKFTIESQVEGIDAAYRAALGGGPP